MCIICRLGAKDDFDGPKKATAFLDAFERAKGAMQAATDAMAECAKMDPHYDRTHKRMVSLQRDWNRIEQEREAGDGRHATPPPQEPPNAP